MIPKNVSTTDAAALNKAGLPLTWSNNYKCLRQSDINSGFGGVVTYTPSREKCGEGYYDSRG